MKGNQTMNTNTASRPLHTIASEAIMDMESIARGKGKYWRNVFPYLAPYADAMMSLNSIEDNYMWDSGREIVCRFISNAATWKGEVAKRVKAELRKMVGLK
jgi:hypothetical protein